MKNIIIIVGLSLFLLSCEGRDNEAKEKKVLHIYVAADSPPFEFYNKVGNQFELVGFDVDLARRVAKHLNREAHFYDVDFKMVLPQLTAKSPKEYAIAISSITATEERRKRADFSTPYYFHNVGVLRHRHTNLNLVDYTEGRLGVQIGSSLEPVAATYHKDHPELIIVPYKKLDEMIQDVLDYKIDGALLEETPANVYAELYKWSLFFEPLEKTRLEYAIALPKDSELTARINDILKQLERSGVLDELYKKWFVARIHAPESEVSEVL